MEGLSLDGVLYKNLPKENNGKSINITELTDAQVEEYIEKLELQNALLGYDPLID